MKEDLGLGRAEAGSFAGLLSFRPFAPVKVDFKALQTIAAALRRKRALRFRYRALGKEVIQRIHGLPYHAVAAAP